MDEIDMLKWAAGAPVRLPPFGGVRDERILYLLGIDEERVLVLLREHRLAHRFMFRVLEEQPGWCTRALHGEVASLCRSIESTLQKQVRATQEIAAALGPDAGPPIPIKGF